jgi:hypothetical protein
MSSKIYPDDLTKNIARSKARIEELEFTISDIRKQKGWINRCLSLDPTIVHTFRMEIKREENKIEELLSESLG